MKRIMACLIAVLFLLGIAFSSAEEQPASADFFQALGNWARNLNLDQSDYEGSVSWNSGLTCEASLRKDQRITELDVPGLGRAQLDDQKILLDLNGMKFGVDLTMLEDILRSFTSGTGSLSEDIQALQPWLEKAFRDILLPCISIRNTGSGLSFHLEADERQITERVYAWVDEILAERKTIEKLLKQYGSFLAPLIPDMPKTVDELAQIWQSVRQQNDWNRFSIGADITCSGESGSLAFTSRAKLSIEQVMEADLSAELIRNEEGLDLYASLDVRNNRSMSSNWPIALECHYRDYTIQGILAVQGITYQLEAGARPDPDGSVIWTACLTGKNARDRVFMKYDLDAVLNPVDNSWKASLYKTGDIIGNADEQQEKLATLEVCRRLNGWDAVLSLPNLTYKGHISSGDQYGRLKIECLGSGGSRYWNADAWLYYPEKECRIRVETSLSGYYWHATVYSLTLRMHELEYAVSDGLETVTRMKISYHPTQNGFVADMEYMNRWTSNPRFSTWNRPSRLKIVREGNHYDAELEWTWKNATLLSAAGMLDLDPTGRFRKLTIDATKYDPYGNESESNFNMTIIPDIITYVDQTGSYELRIKENTASRMVIHLTKNDRDELGSLILTLDDENAFNALLTVSEKEMGSLIIRPVSKEPIEKISEEKMIMLNLETLRYLLEGGTLIR